jgi:7-keto-8-aminopelargonate synthetase-like enzyme
LRPRDTAGSISSIITEPPSLQQIDRTYVLFGQKKLSYFSGCDYFRLSSHHAVLRALREGAEKFGLNVAASRSTTGNHKLYAEIEQGLGEFFGAESALLLSSGYSANLAAAQAMAGDFSHVLIDERAHASLSDAAGILGCPIVQFRHRDPENVAGILRVIGSLAKPIIFTDGMFSHDGSVAPLDSYHKLLPRNGRILVDDAHAAGVLGNSGQGTAEYLGLPRRRIIQTVTLSKAFGVYGGAVLGPKSLRGRILEKSRLFVGNTPMPLPLVCAALKSLRILKTTGALRAHLADNVRYVKEELRKMQYPVEATPSPIVSLFPQDCREIELWKRLLLARGIYPPLIYYPGGPTTGYFRFAISSEHSREQLADLVRALVGARNPQQRGAIDQTIAQRALRPGRATGEGASTTRMKRRDQQSHGTANDPE